MSKITRGLLTTFCNFQMSHKDYLRCPKARLSNFKNVRNFLNLLRIKLVKRNKKQMYHPNNKTKKEYKLLII